MATKKPSPHRLLLLLIILFILSPLWQTRLGRLIHDIFLFIALLVIIDIFHLRSKSLKILYRLLAFIALLLDTIIWLKLFPIHLALITFNIFIEICFLGMAILIILRRIYFEDKVTNDTIRNGINVYLLIGIIFAIIYRAIHLEVPQSFYLPFAEQGSTFDPFYFSFLTLTTVGYGDIIPISPWVRVLTNLEGIAGILYPTTIIARLVSLYILHNHQK
ncbi:potassium channel family protein [Gloeothece verrucosa]|uniref:Ion transport 2 domain protein n=1 Tax=Gloeothece verrucosa (strain PCC 7822) TaxID=497965 RepID=E0ULN6_GLOV7|nr:potassium channel family protein [Gloeothece verrucosa]ADN17866.1 Ion transport 2 domain protein [Gloeothece verrucosa PCC 7822]